MLKINKFSSKALIAVLLVSAVSLSGCKFSILSDSGSDSQIKIEKSEYLALDVLEEDESVGLTSGYETYEVQYGTFKTQVLSQKAEIYIPTYNFVNAEFTSGEMKFINFLVAEGSYIEKGDPVASVSMSTDPISIEEAELALGRLKEEYESAKNDHAESLKDREGPFYLNEDEMQVLKYSWQVADIRWEQTVTNYENRISNEEENIKDMKANAAITTIDSPYSGYVVSLARLEPDDYLKKGQMIVGLVPNDDLYVSVVDSAMAYGLGQKVTFNASQRRGYSRTYDAVVVSPPGRDSYLELNTGKTYFKVDASLMDVYFMAYFSITADIKSIDNVLIVPNSAVTSTEKCCFVTVIKEDGSLVNTPFIAGGSTAEYYWVLSGLEEGMKVIVK